MNGAGHSDALHIGTSGPVASRAFKQGIANGFTGSSRFTDAQFLPLTGIRKPRRLPWRRTA